MPDDAANYVSVILTPTFTAAKLTIAKPDIPAQIYTGRALQAAVAQSADYTVTNDTYTEAGTHDVTHNRQGEPDQNGNADAGLHILRPEVPDGR